MNAVERLAREMAFIYGAAKWVEPEIAARSSSEFAEDAQEFLYKLQAPQRTLIMKWRLIARELEHEVVRLNQSCWPAGMIRQQQEIRTMRRLAMELEKALEGQSDEQ